MARINSSNKGRRWEQDAVKLLTELIPNSEWKRMPTSGAMGTILGEPSLVGDIKGRVEGLTQELRGEAKVGYSKSKDGKSMTIKREWLEKIAEEARRTYALPFVIGKFSGARGAAKEFIILEIDIFAYLLNLITEQSKEIAELIDEREQKLEAD